jgi:hypothetical protein
MKVNAQAKVRAKVQAKVKEGATAMTIHDEHRAPVGRASFFALMIATTALLFFPSCVGSVQSGAVPPTAGSAPAGTGGSTAGGVATGGRAGDAPTASLPPPSMSSPPTAEAAGPLALRRLTTREYNNIVADLVGDTSRPADLFPADAPSDSGFVAPIEVGELHVQRYEEAAAKVADAALAANTLAIPCTNPTAAAESACAKQFVQQFGRKAFRRPLTAMEEMGLTTLFGQARTIGLDFKQSIGQTARAILQAPGFLYHWEAAVVPTAGAANAVVPLTSHQIASRLSFFLWETMPDAELSAAADADTLLTPEAVEAQARRMLASPKSKLSLDNFHTHWLLVENLDNLQKSAGKYPFYGDPLRASLAPALAEFTSSILGAGGDGTLKSLLTAPYAYVNAALAPIYGVTATADALTRVELPATQRAGILTQPTFLASRASPSASNPIYRGVSVYRQLLCGPPRAVPGNVPPVEPEVVGKSTRDRYAGHAQGFCATCHAPFDPLGFAFENYDAVGAYRTMDGGKPVDATGTTVTPGGVTISFNNAIELTSKLAESDEVKWCVTKNWFRYMLGRPETDAEKGSMELAFRTASATPGYSLREVIVSAVRSMAFRFRTVSPGEGI